MLEDPIVLILLSEYRSHNCVVAFDTEKVNNALAIGLNTQSEDLIIIKCNNITHVDNLGRRCENSTPDYMYTLLEFDSILVIGDNGVSLILRHLQYINMSLSLFKHKTCIVI